MATGGPAFVDRFSRVLAALIDAAHCDGILLSGGLDTSTIAAYARKSDPLAAVSVCVRPDEQVDAAHREMLAAKLGCDPAEFPAPDARYARACAQHLGIELNLVSLTLDALLAHAPGTVRAIGSFDPMQVRNGITIYCGLLAARQLGLRRVFTGDGADEMFAGYSHMWGMGPDKLPAHLRHMASIMRFTTPELAAAVGIEIRSPFTETELVNLALELPHGALIGEREGRRMGKWIIRRSVEALLPGELVWRVKTPIEYGSGSTFLAPLLAARITDGEFASARDELLARDGLRLRDKEQLYYYRLYREVFGPVPGISSASQADCPYCGTLIDPPSRNYCGVCGAWGFQPSQAGGN